MQCLIIAAGQGTRLRALSPSKPLAELNGSPLIEHVVRRASAGGADTFVVVTGYEAGPIEAFLGQLSLTTGIGITIAHNNEWTRPNGLSVLAAADLLENEFLLLMSDHVFDPAIIAGLLAKRGRNRALTLAGDFDVGDPLLDLEDATKLLVGEDSRIRRIGKALDDYNAIDTGIFHATHGLVDAIRASLVDGGGGSLSEGVQRLAEGGGAFVHDIGTGWWIDVDDEPSFRRAEQWLRFAAESSLS